jgi:Protein of unknown function (DUF3108)
MHDVRTAAAALITLAIGLSAAERPVPFRVGETLTYDVSWSSYLTAGTAVATVDKRQVVDGAAAYHIVAEGQPVSLVSRLYRLDYRMETLLDVETLLPRRASVYVEEGSRKRTHPTDFDRKRTPAATDPIAAMYSLRAAGLKPGAALRMPVVDNGKTYDVRMTVGAVESIAATGRTVSAWRIAVDAADESGGRAGRNMAVWISTDPRRLPVKLQADLPIGSFSLVLRDAR